MKKQQIPTERISTHFLRIVIFIMGAVAILLGILILPAIYTDWDSAYPVYTYLKYPFLLCLGATVIPFFVALYQTLRLLGFVDKGTAFSVNSVDALRRITYSGVVFGLLYAACLPALYIVTEHMDAPGLLVIGLTMTFAPIAISVFAAVLQKLLQSAIDIKTENDLTV